jgi:TonB-linked SusC/RagA family outer membrane protein
MSRSTAAPPRGRRSLVAAFLLTTFASTALAQGSGTIAGRVVSERTGAAIPEAQVAVADQRAAAVTDANGVFRLIGLSGSGTVSVTVRRLGYSPRTQPIEIGNMEVRIVLADRAMELGGVVVTGTAGVTEKRALGNAVTTISAADVVATRALHSFQDLLTGRASGVSVVASSGQVGTGSRIRVRGASSLSLNNNPLIYVDGVRVDNTQASGPSVQAFGSASISRWNDFNPDDIESVEVIKGPAAATLYGTEAAAGVIQIITKKGTAGRASWNAVWRVGGNWVPDWETRFPDNFGTIPLGAGVLDTVSISTRQLNDSLQSRFGRDIFETGLMQDMQVSVSGGTPALRYYVGVGYEKNQGAEPVNRLTRYNMRLNLSAAPSPAWDVSSAVGFTSGRTYLPYEAGGGGATWGTYFSSPSFLYLGTAPNNPQLGFRSGPPDIYYDAYNNFQDADRFTGSLTFTNRPRPWLNHRLIVGIDRLSEDNQSLSPRNDFIGTTYAAFSGLAGPTFGSVGISTREVAMHSFDYLANVDLQVTPAWRSVSSIGGQFYGRTSLSRSASGSGFPSAGLTSLAAAAIRTIGTDELFETASVGGFIQQQAIWHDRLYLTAAMRADDNSAFGANFDVVKYPKLSASYVLSEEPRLKLPDWVNDLRVRAAFGGSGQQPGAFDAIRTYTAVAGFLTPLNAGNPDLGPEKSLETEIGFDAGLLDDKLGLEVTFFSGVTRDAILSRLAPPSAGFPGDQLFNAGRVDRFGLEWLLRYRVLDRPEVWADFTMSGSTLKQEIKSLGGGTNVVAVTSNVQHVVGYSPGAWWDKRIVSADYNPTTHLATNLQCDDGNGGVMPCATAPRVWLGNSVPTREGSYGLTVGFLRDFTVSAMIDYRGGYKKLDGNYRARCGAFSLCRELWFPDDPQYPRELIAAVQGGTTYTYHLIKDASFTRFRELSLTYNAPATIARALRAAGASITISGRNLALWTDYPGVEPEASFNSGTRGGAYGQWEQNVTPQLRQFVTTFNLRY